MARPWHLLQLAKSENPETLWEEIKSGKTAKEIKEQRKEKSFRGTPAIEPWTWKPEDKSFAVTIKFKKQNYDKKELIQALFQVIEALQNQSFLK